MRRITLWVMSTLSLLVLLFSYHTSLDASAHPTANAAVVESGSGSTSNSGTSRTTTSGSGDGGTDTSGGDGGSTSSGSSSAGGSTSSSTASKTYTGDSVDTQYGPVQVRITVANGKVRSATAIDYPTENPRDQEINSVAVPQLEAETKGTTSSSIDMVSGATFTSNAYVQSLQSALDQANIS